MNDAPNIMAETNDFEFQALQEAKNYRAALVKEFRDFLRGNVLEVGAGVGQFTETLLGLPAIAKLVSIEPDPAFCERLQLSFPHLSVVQGTIANLEQRSNWNAILSVNVLEHINDDEGELKGYHDLLANEKGVVCLFVPARREIYAPLDRDFGHFRRYTRRSLRNKLESAGFEVLTLRYFNFVGYFAWWLNFCVLKKRSFNRGAVVFFDRVCFPAMYALESRVLRPPIGQSVLAVARARRDGDVSSKEDVPLPHDYDARSSSTFDS
jgi:SAM-dependent methyltransferase